jgi:hypothetical protein
LGLAVLGVFVAMNILVSAAPYAISFGSGSPSPSLAPSFAGSPSLLPFATTAVETSPVPSASLPDYRPTYVNSAIHANDPNGVWRVYLLYPAFVAGTTPWADMIDADISGEVATRAAQWEQGPAANRQIGNKINDLSGTFKTELLTPALAAFTLTWVDDSSASAPATGVETLNYDLSTGQRIAFDDVFTDPDAALSVMSIRAAAQLRTQLGPGTDAALLADGTSPTRANFANWAITPYGIKITFGEHQVSPTQGLTPVAVVLRTDLLSTMIPTGPVAKLAGLAG